jgi:hypothetical protein
MFLALRRDKVTDYVRVKSKTGPIKELFIGFGCAPLSSARLLGCTSLETISRNEVSHLESPLRKVRRRAAGAASPTKGDDVFSKRAQPIFRKCERAGLPL